MTLSQSGKIMGLLTFCKWLQSYSNHCIMAAVNYIYPLTFLYMAAVIMILLIIPVAWPTRNP